MANDVKLGRGTIMFKLNSHNYIRELESLRHRLDENRKTTVGHRLHQRQSPTSEIDLFKETNTTEMAVRN